MEGVHKLVVQRLAIKSGYSACRRAIRDAVQGGQPVLFRYKGYQSVEAIGTLVIGSVRASAVPYRPGAACILIEATKFPIDVEAKIKV